MLDSYSNPYNLTEIYATIGRFFQDGEMELKKVINTIIANPDIFKSTWKTFDFDLGKILNIIPVGTTAIQPSFSSYIEINNKDYGDLTRIKRVHYFVSLLGPYYAIIGEDLSKIIVENDSIIYITNYLIASPIKEYAHFFEIVSKEIEGRFKDYRFIPFFISEQISDVTPTFDIGQKFYTIFESLFKPGFDLTRWTVGDKFYNDKNWVDKESKTQGGFSIFPGKII